MTPFDLFKTQLSETGPSCTEAKVDAMKRLSVVSYAMGVDDTLSVLLPYLATIAMKINPPNEDELLIHMAKELRKVVPSLLHGTKALPLLPILERLAAVEETVVRDEAVNTINHVAPYLLWKKPAAAGGEGDGGTDAADAAQEVEPSSSSIPSVLIAMAKRLESSDWFTSKVSAAGILPTVYKVTKDDELIHLMKELSLDDTPMVRRSCAKHLGEFISYTVDNDDAKGKAAEGDEPKTATATGEDEKTDGGGDGSNKEDDMDGGDVVHELHDGLVNDLVPILTNLCNDEQDSVRLLAVASIGNVGVAFSSSRDYEYVLSVLLPLIKNGSTDLSWRVRHNLSKTFSNVAAVLGIGSNQRMGVVHASRYEKQKAHVMSCFVVLLQDIEAEVRAASVGHLARMVHWGGPALFSSHLSPLLPALADDVVMEVRSKCALALMDSCKYGTLSDDTILGSFGPLLENFLQDEFSEVQLHVLNNLPKISRLLEKMNGVVSSILNMAKASNWRVRRSVSSLLPHLANARGLDFFLQVLLEPAWLTLLLDNVASVRAACVSGVQNLRTVSGSAWFHSNIVPHHVRIYGTIAASSYLIRNTILQCHIETAKSIISSGRTGGSGGSSNTADAAAAAAAGDGTGDETGLDLTSSIRNNNSTEGDVELWQEMMRILCDVGLTDKVDNVRMVSARGVYEILSILLHNSKDDVVSGGGGGNNKGGGTEDDGGGDVEELDVVGIENEQVYIDYVDAKIRPILETCIQNEQDDDVRYYLDMAIN